MSTSIGFVIQPGQTIPEDVTGVRDGGGDFWQQRDGRWSVLLNDGSWDGSVLAEDVLEFVPLTVTAVREQPAEPNQRARDNHAAMIAQGCCGMVAVHLADCPQFDRDALETQLHEYVQPAEPDTCPAHGAHPHNGVTCLDCPICRPPAPAAESVPDVLDLVRQFGNEYDVRTFTEDDELLARIEAAVQRLRDERKHANRVAESALSMVVARESETETLAATFLSSTNKLTTERDEALAEVERLRRLLKTQAFNFAAASAQQPDPRVLSLPQVPEGAILIGARTQRHWIWSEAFQLWVTENDKRNLGDLLSLEREVEVRLAPPREPRTWPKLDDEPEIENPPAVVDVGEEGRWRRVTEPGAERLYAGPGREGNWRLSLRGLRFLGDVTEVFDDEAGTR